MLLGIFLLSFQFYFPLLHLAWGPGKLSCVHGINQAPLPYGFWLDLVSERRWQASWRAGGEWSGIYIPIRPPARSLWVGWVPPLKAKAAISPSIPLQVVLCPWSLRSRVSVTIQVLLALGTAPFLVAFLNDAHTFINKSFINLSSNFQSEYAICFCQDPNWYIQSLALASHGLEAYSSAESSFGTVDAWTPPRPTETESSF